MPVPVTPEEKLSPLYKYFEWDRSIPLEKLQEMVANNPLTPETALRAPDLNRLFDDGYLPGEFGWCLFEDGTGTIANLTDMPNVTVEMMDWWFAWHGLEPLRYKIWDPNNHIHCLTRHPEIVLDKSLPMKKRYQNTIHDIAETHLPGQEPGRVPIFFRDPADIGFDAEKLAKFDGTIICSGNHMAPVVMAHFVRPKSTGVELRSRFWYGYSIIGGKPVPNSPPGFKVGEGRLVESLMHLINEFHSLSLLLPQVYAEYKDTF